MGHKRRKCPNSPASSSNSEIAKVVDYSKVLIEAMSSGTISSSEEGPSATTLAVFDPPIESSKFTNSRLSSVQIIPTSEKPENSEESLVKTIFTWFRN